MIIIFTGMFLRVLNIILVDVVKMRYINGLFILCMSKVLLAPAGISKKTLNA